jgi:hypothetical protein
MIAHRIGKHASYWATVRGVDIYRVSKDGNYFDFWYSTEPGKEDGGPGPTFDVRTLPAPFAVSTQASQRLVFDKRGELRRDGVFNMRMMHMRAIDATLNAGIDLLELDPARLPQSEYERRLGVPPPPTDGVAALDDDEPF